MLLFLKTVSCSATTFSNILDRSRSLDIGLKFLGSDGPKLDCLRSSSIMICLKKLGNVPVDRERLINLVTQGSIKGNTFKRTLQAKTSDEQKEGFISERQNINQCY